MSTGSYGSDGTFDGYMQNNANIAVAEEPEQLFDCVEYALDGNPGSYESLARETGERIKEKAGPAVCVKDVDAALKSLVAFEREFLGESLNLSGNHRQEEVNLVKSISGSFVDDGIDKRRAAELGWEIDRYDVENTVVTDDDLQSRTERYPDAPADDGMFVA